MKNKIIVNAHSSICINDNIYIDPYKLDDNLEKAKIILITHSHFDHYSKEDMKKIMDDDTMIIMPKDIMENGIHMDIYDTVEIDEIKIESVPAYNINKPMHPKDNHWLGYVLTINGERIYICGDTDKITEGMKVKCDILCVPIGGVYTMNYKEAAEFTNEIHPKEAIPIHYGLIVGTHEDFKQFKELVSSDIIVKEMIK